MTNSIEKRQKWSVRFNVYGSAQKRNAYSGVITSFVRNSLGDRSVVIHGEQTRDFIHIEDIVSGARANA